MIHDSKEPDVENTSKSFLSLSQQNAMDEVKALGFNASTPKKSGSFFVSFSSDKHVQISPIKSCSPPKINHIDSTVAMTTTSKATPGDLVMDAPRPTIRKRKLFAYDVMKHHRQKRPKKDVNLGNPIDVDKIITKSPIKSPSPWLPSIGLSQIERDTLISQSCWLNDRIVNAAQLLIKIQTLEFQEYKM